MKIFLLIPGAATLPETRPGKPLAGLSGRKWESTTMYLTLLGEGDTPNYSNTIWGFFVTIGCTRWKPPTKSLQLPHQEVESNSPPLERGLDLATCLPHRMIETYTDDSQRASAQPSSNACSGGSHPPRKKSEAPDHHVRGSPSEPCREC